MDITAFVLLKDMLDQTKREILTLKHSTYLALAQLLQYREQEDFAAFQKRQQNNAKRRKKNEEMNVAAAAAVVKKENV
jgi:ribosomal protein L18